MCAHRGFDEAASRALNPRMKSSNNTSGITHGKAISVELRFLDRANIGQRRVSAHRLPSSEVIQVVCPCPHHEIPFLQIACPIISASIGEPLDVPKFMFNQVLLNF